MALRKADIKVFHQAYSSFPDETKKKDSWKYWEAVRLHKQGQFSKAKKQFYSLRDRQNFYGYLASAQEKKDNEKMVPNRSFSFAKPVLKKNKFSWVENDDLKDILKLFKSHFFHSFPSGGFLLKTSQLDELLSLARICRIYKYMIGVFRQQFIVRQIWGSSSDIPLFTESCH